VAIESIETTESREFMESLDDSTRQKTWVLWGSDDEEEIQQEVENLTPGFYLGLQIQDYTVVPDGGVSGMWKATANYGIKKQPVGTAVISFDTTGGSEHHYQSISTIASYPIAGATAPNFRGAINVTRDGIQGVDEPPPTFRFQVTQAFDSSYVTNSYIASLAAMTRRTNSAIFGPFAIGTLLFMGASGSRRGFEDWEITFQFGFRENLTGITAGTITGIDKKGWEILWTLYRELDDANTLVRQPYCAYVEQIFYSGDFSTLGISL